MARGYEEFTTGQLVPTATINDKFIKQGVLYFADATARDAAITAPEEGMHAYLADTDVVTAYDGAAWRVVFRVVSTKGTLLAADGTGLASLAPGTNTHVLTADSAQATGVKWAALPAGDHIEAKVTAGASHSESVTWTSAFGSVPVVVSSAETSAGIVASVSSRSTTGATVYTTNTSGTWTNTVKLIIAREAS